MTCGQALFGCRLPAQLQAQEPTAVTCPPSHIGATGTPDDENTFFIRILGECHLFNVACQRLVRAVKLTAATYSETWIAN